MAGDAVMSYPARLAVAMTAGALSVLFIGAAACGQTCPLSARRVQPRPLIHSNQDVFIAGEYRVKEEVLRRAHAENVSGYNNVPADRFLTQTIVLPSGPKVIRAMQYPVDGDPSRMGYRLVPVRDTRGGSAELDSILRAKMGLARNDPIFAQVSTNHAEAWLLTFENMGAQYAPQSGQTHSRGYLGFGRPIDSPENYHGRRWKNRGYPHTLYIVKLGDTPYAETNQNAQIAWMTLSKDVRFPGSHHGGRPYKNDFYKTIDLAGHLRFYRNWIIIQATKAGLRGLPAPDQDLLKDPDFYTYCRETAAMAETIMLNVPHNEAAFKEIWGEAEGAALFRAIRGAWPNIVRHRKSRFRNGEHEQTLSSKLPETVFTPLWKLEGIQDPRNATWARLLSEGKPGWAGTIMPPQTSSDLVLQTIANYVPFVESGGVLTSAAILGFKSHFEERTGIGEAAYRSSEGLPDIELTDNVYLAVAIPVLSKIQVADGLAAGLTSDAQLDAFVAERTVEIAAALSGRQQPDPAAMALAQGIMSTFQDPATRDLILGCTGMSRTEAWAWLRGAIEPDLETARGLPVCARCVKWYQQPATTHWVALGLWPKSEHVTITPVATAMAANELTKTVGSERIPLPSGMPDSD